MSVAKTCHDQLIVLDDTPEVAELVGELAEQAGYRPTVTTCIDAFNTAIERSTPGVIVLDLQMPDADGIQVLRQLSASGSNSKILLITGMDKRTVISAQRYGRQAGLNMLGALQKPLVPEAVIAALKKARGLTGQVSAADLGAAIHDSSLELKYQPVVRRLGKHSWHAESVEALPRWHHADFGVLTPGQFLPVVGSERSALMQQLTDYVLQRGALQLRQWQSDGLHLGLRVNVAAGLITDTDFPDRLERLLQEYDADPSLLTLEISDASYLALSRDGIEILTRLRLKGVNLSLDDFGSVGCVLNHIYTLPMNEVKIDRCITADLTHESGAQTMFRGLLQIFRQLDLACCAEGVESSEQLEALDEMQCDLAQGFHISTPVPSADIPKVLKGWTAESNRRLQSVR